MKLIFCFLVFLINQIVQFNAWYFSINDYDFTLENLQTSGMIFDLYNNNGTKIYIIFIYIS